MSVPRVEPEWAVVTVAFVDIRGFTAFADRSTAHAAVAYLNEFFEVAAPVVARHGGGCTKLLGDGLMTVFGAADHADRALAASIELLGAVDAALGDRCRIGIGLNSGLVLVGTMGVGEMQELGVVGDPVNVASRVQDATRDLREPLLVTEATRLLLERDPPPLVARGTLSLKGKAEPVAIYAPALVTLPGRLGRRKELA